ncbi:MAG: hypothetical protein WC997_00750 [Porticoccaceae bacterium]
MKRLLLFFPIFLLFLSAMVTSKPINEPIPSSFVAALEKKLNKKKLDAQTSSYQFSNIEPKELVGKKVKPGSMVSLNFKGKVYHIVFKETHYIENDNVVHWIGHLTGNTDNEVLFIIEKDSFFGQKDEGVSLSFNMSGVIKTNEGNIRIRPSDQNNTHIIYTQDDGSESYLSLSESAFERRARFLEAKIKQYQFLSQISPEDYRLSPNGTINTILRASDHLKVSLDVELLKSGRQEAGDAVLSYLIGNYPKLGGEEFQYRSTENVGDAVIYEYDERINGLLVEGSGAQIAVNKNTGKIGYISTSYFIDPLDESHPEVTERGALEMAEKFVSENSYEDFRDLSVLSDRSALVYLPDYDSGVPSLKLHWRIVFDAKTGGIMPPVYVDADSGEVFIISRASGASDVRICDGSQIVESRWWCNHMPTIIDSGQANPCISGDS